MSHDARGNMLTRTAPAPLSHVESWTYNSRKDVTAYSNGRGKTTSYGYDGNGNLTTITHPGGVTTTFARDPSTGLVTGVTDPRGKTTGFGYDAAHTWRRSQARSGTWRR
jgi:YD repeat-containing protein